LFPLSANLVALEIGFRPNPAAELSCSHLAIVWGLLGRSDINTIIIYSHPAWDHLAVVLESRDFHWQPWPAPLALLKLNPLQLNIVRRRRRA